MAGGPETHARVTHPGPHLGSEQNPSSWISQMGWAGSDQEDFSGNDPHATGPWQAEVSSRLRGAVHFTPTTRLRSLSRAKRHMSWASLPTYRPRTRAPRNALIELWFSASHPENQQGRAVASAYRTSTGSLSPGPRSRFLPVRECPAGGDNLRSCRTLGRGVSRIASRCERLQCGIGEKPPVSPVRAGDLGGFSGVKCNLALGVSSVVFANA